MRGSSKNKRHKKKGREQLFEAIDKMSGEERELLIAALSPKMKALFTKWTEEK